MAINIKNPEVELAVRKLANSMGVDMTEAIGLAVSHELDRSGKVQVKRLTAMKAISSRVKEMPVLDDRSAEQILGYDEVGLPQ